MIGLGEVGQTGAALELVGGREERLTADQVDVDAGIVVVPVSITASGSVPVFASYVCLGVNFSRRSVGHGFGLSRFQAFVEFAA